MKFAHLALALLLLHGIAPLHSQTVKDREGAVRGDAERMESEDEWIYNNLPSAFAEAKQSGKPLMVVLRCVPCLGCLGIDTEVLMENRDLAPLMDQFVRVRVINANSLDLSLFQFDFDLSFSVLFFDGEGNIYGRFGSWEHQEDSQNRATAGLRLALERVLQLHEHRETRLASLAGKKGDPMPWPTPVDMPAFQGKYRPELDWNGNVVKSCVHCHQVGDAIRLHYRDRGQDIPLKWILP